MTTKQADRIIAEGRVVRVKSKMYSEQFAAVFIKRNRFDIYTANGGVYDCSDLELLTTESEDS